MKPRTETALSGGDYQTGPVTLDRGRSQENIYLQFLPSYQMLSLQLAKPYQKPKRMAYLRVIVDWLQTTRN